MKHNVIYFISVLLLSLVTAGANASEKIRMAISEFQGGISQQQVLTDLLTQFARTHTQKYQIVPTDSSIKSAISRYQSELETGITHEQNAFKQETVSAEQVLIPKADIFGSTYVLTAKILDLKTFQVLKQQMVMEKGKSDQTLLDLVDDLWLKIEPSEVETQQTNQSGSQTEPQETTPSRSVRILTGAGVRLRQQARQNAQKAGKLSIGTIVSELDSFTNHRGEIWYQVDSPSGSGWIHGKYTMLFNQAEPVPAYIEVANRKLNSSRASFGDLVELCDFLNRVSQQVDGEHAVTLKQLYLTALQRSFDKIPPGRETESPYAQWLEQNNRQQATTDPSTWIIKRDYVFNADGQPRNSYFREILQQLESYQGEGSRITQAEFEKLLDRQEAKHVYVNELIKYATPISVKLQNQTHRDYSEVFMREKRLRAGVEFLSQYETLLKKAQKRYGVARHDIVSILMWESGLGEFTGNFRIFNVFMGQLLFLELAQQRAVEQMVAKGKKNPLESDKIAKREKKRVDKIKKRAAISLVALLRQSKAKGIEPLSVKGSGGGAIGYVQFMPYRLNYAVDGDGNGIINLHSWPDAILSVANYLKDFGNYDMSYKGRKSGIFSYNHNDAYVKGVIAYADTIWKRYINKE